MSWWNDDGNARPATAGMVPYLAEAVDDHRVTFTIGSGGSAPAHPLDRWFPTVSSIAEVAPSVLDRKR